MGAPWVAGGLNTVLVLAFDAACERCRALAARAAGVGPGLDVLPLADYRVREWRAEAGVDRHTPTLIAVTPGDDGDDVRAWTGPRMAVVLVRRLGVRRALRLARALLRG